MARQVAHAHQAKVNDVVLAAVAGDLFGLVAVQRAWYRLLVRQRTVNLVVTNVPGPPVPLYLGGARLLELFPVAAIMGNLTLAVAVFSYAGQLNLAAIADRDTCPDLEVFAQGMQAALDDLERPVCHTEAMRLNLLLR